MFAIVVATSLFCAAPTAVDGDNFRCDGVNMRVEGINAREMDGSCHRSAPCPSMSGPDARAVMARLIAGGLSYEIQYRDRFDRPVVRATLRDGRDLAQALVDEGAAAIWPRYWRGGNGAQRRGSCSVYSGRCWPTPRLSCSASSTDLTGRGRAT